MVVTMKRFIVEPGIRIGDAAFGCSREDARKVFGKRFKELKKSVFSKNTMDVYSAFHVYYTENDEFDAIEIFGRVKVVIGDNTVFPTDVNSIKKIFAGLQIDKESMIDKNNNMAFSISQADRNIVDSVLIGREGYFDSSEGNNEVI